MRLTLLEYVQNILSSLNLDQVNSISDTPESVQVAEAVKTSYLNLLGRLDMPGLNQLFQLNASNDPDAPVLMLKPDGLAKIDWVKYFDTNPADGNQLQSDQFGAYSHGVNTDLQNNAGGWSTPSTTSNIIGTGLKTFTVNAGLSINPGDAALAYNGTAFMQGTVSTYSGVTLVINVTNTNGSGTFSVWTIFNGSSLPVGPGYKEVKIVSVVDFLRMTNNFNPQDNDVATFELSVMNNDTGQMQNFQFNYRDDVTPQHCCIIAEQYIVFDSYDNTQDSTLQSAKTMCMGWVYPQFSMTDSFIPSLQDQQVPLLINEAKSLAFYEIKNQPHQKSEVEVKRQIAAYQKFKAIADRPTYFDELPDYGRRGGYYTLWP